MFNYTFTDRFEYELQESERELRTRRPLVQRYIDAFRTTAR